METADDMLKRAYRKAKDFFKIDLPVVKLYIIKDKAELINDRSYKSQRKWQGAGFFRKNAVIVMDKSFFKDLGYKEEEFNGVIVHELSHIFIKHLVKKPIPIWIEEGLCNFLSFPDIKIKPKKVVDLNKIITLNDWYKYNTPFVYCAYFFHVLSKDYGNKKILEFIKRLGVKEVRETFLKIFGISLEDFINKVNSHV